MFTFDAYPKRITVTPQSKAGSKVGTITLLIDEAQASNITSFSFYIPNSYFIIHNNSGQIKHYPNVHPTFHFLVNNKTDISLVSFFHFQNLSSAQCVYNLTTYLIVSFDIVLSTDSLYHLGEHNVYLYGHGYSDGFQSSDFSARISLHVQAGINMSMCTYASMLTQFFYMPI